MRRPIFITATWCEMNQGCASLSAMMHSVCARYARVDGPQSRSERAHYSSRVGKLRSKVDHRTCARLGHEELPMATNPKLPDFPDIPARKASEPAKVHLIRKNKFPWPIVILIVGAALLVTI